MKNLFFLLLVLTIAGCKKKEISEQVTPQELLDPTKLFAIQSFSVEGVPAKNIRFLLKNNQSYVIITLPADYQNGNLLKITTEMPNGFFISPSAQLDNRSGKFALSYQGEYVSLTITDANKNALNGIGIVVQPSAPLKVQGLVSDVQYTIDGMYKYVKLTIENWGTEMGVSNKDSLVTIGKISIRNKKTGSEFSGNAGYRISGEENVFTLDFPIDAEDGEYQITLQKDSRSLTLPNNLIIKYGQPTITFYQDGWNKHSYEGKNVVSFQGYNLTDNHTYELQLKNDFSEPVSIKLTTSNRFKIQGQLPSGFSKGNYEMKLLSDGKEVKSSGLDSPALLLAKKDSIQPAMLVLSQPKEVIYGEVYLYKAITSFDRNEPLITWIEANSKSKYIELKNTESGQIFKQGFTGFTKSPIPFPYIMITPEIPNGRYEVRLSTENQLNSDLSLISEPYHKIITIY